MSWTSFKTVKKFAVVSATCALSLATLSYYNGPRTSYCENQLHEPISCKNFVKQYKEEFGIPGVVVAVSRNGETIYSRGFGYSDVENNVKAHSGTVMRIASISKALTSTIALKLVEQNKLDLDKPVDEYLTYLPPFKYKNQAFKITPRQLLSHTAGIRHYKENKSEKKAKDQRIGDTEFPEFFLNQNFKTTKDALSIFVNDELLNEPGKSYFYTTFGYTLLSAVLEETSKEKSFTNLLSDLFKEFDMKATLIDLNDPIVQNRSKYYSRNEKKRLVNVPYVDNSYKWAGGGVLSNVGDLIKFGNKMLQMYQANSDSDTFLKSSTISQLAWSKQSCPSQQKSQQLCEPGETISYGLGWFVCHDKNGHLKYVYHTGGAVGATSCLLIIPDPSEGLTPPKGLVVAVLCNSDSVAEITKFTLGVAEYFKQ